MDKTGTPGAVAPAARYGRKPDITDATLHTLRVTVCTLVHEHGESSRSARHLLAHATDPTTHRNYSQFTPADASRIAPTMEDIFRLVEGSFDILCLPLSSAEG